MMCVRLLLPMVLSVPASLSAQAPPNQTPPPDDGVYALAVDPAAYPGQDYVLLLDDGLAVIESDGRSSYSARQIAQILTSEGAAALGEFAFAYTPGRQNLRINWMRVIADGTVQEGPAHQTESDAGTQLGVPVYSDQRIMQATLAGVAPGALVDYSYTIETLQPRLAGDLLYDWAVNLFVPVVRSRFVLDAPADMALRVSEQNLDVAPDTSIVGGRLVRTWQIEDIPGIELERYAGWPNEVFMAIRVGGPIAWDEIGAWYAELSRDRFAVVDEITGAFAKVVGNARTLEDSLKAAYRWVKQDFRYVSLALGDGGYQPRTPLEVFRTRFGDCKDKTALFIALARSMGLDAYPVLVSSGGVVDSLLPSLEQFDHMIAALERNGRAEFLDVTAWLTPYGEVPPELQGTVGLAVRDEGTARIVVLPASDPDNNRLEQEIVGTVGRDGTFVGSVTVSASGTEQYELRASFLDFGGLSEAERLDVLQDWSGTWDTAIVDSSRVFEGGDLGAEARMTVWFTAPNVVFDAGDHYMMNLPLGDFADATLVSSLESAGERRFPIDIALVNSPSVHRSVLDMALPEGWKVRLPQSVRVDGPFGYYKGEYQQSRGRFRVSREMGGLRGLLPPDSAGALISWVRDVAEDGTDYILIDRGSGPRLAAVPVAADSSSDLARLLPQAEELGGGAMLVAEGPATGERFLGMSDKRLVSSWTREFGAEQMVFTLGSSQILMLNLSAAEYGSSVEAARGQKFLDLFDISAGVTLGMEQAGIDQARLGEARPMDLGPLRESARGWTMEFVTPLATFDMAYLLHTRGRVSVMLLAMGVQGVKVGDLEHLVAMIDERIRRDEGYLTDLELETVALPQDTEAEGLTVAQRAGGVALDEMLPGPGDFPGSVLSSEELTHEGGMPVYTRMVEGRGFTFPVGGSEVVSMMLIVGLYPTEARALREVLRFEESSPMSSLLDGLKEDELGAQFFSEAESSSQWLDAPRVGSRAAAVAGQLRGAMRADAAGIVFSAGRLVASVMIMTPPDGLDPAALYSIAEGIHRRMLQLAPDVAAGAPSEDLVAAMERATAIEREVDSLVDARMFDAVFTAIAHADSVGESASFDPDTWNKVCWYATLYGFAERAMPACEATVGPDTTVVYRRDSRGLARALVGDRQGAIDDFRYVVEHATAGEFLEARSAWLEALLAGEDPFTDEVLRALREPQE